MPDRWGRPTYHDFLVIANGWNKVEEQNYLRQQRDKTQEYGRRLSAGEQIDPNENDFNFSAFMTAQTALASNKATNAEADKLIREQRQAELDDLIISGEQKLSVGDQPGFWDTMAKTYEYMPDGNKIVGFSEDYSKMVLETPNGQRAYKETPDPKEALQMAKSFSKRYQDIDAKFTDWRRQKNMELLKEQDVWVDSEGRAAIHYNYIGKGGEIVETLVDPQSGAVVGGFDPNSQQFVQPQSDYVPYQAAKTAADIKDRPANKTKTEEEIKNIKSRTDLNEARAEKLRREEGKTADKDQKAKYKADLELMLKPFAGNKATYDDMGNLTDEGKTALDAAQRLVGKYERKEELTPDEKSKLQHAIRAWDIYQQISDDISKDYGKSGVSWKDIQ